MNETAKLTGKSKGLHPRNLHHQRYDFKALVKTCPQLAPAVRRLESGELSIDFADPESVKLLNQALLQHFYQLEFWNIPQDYLCPAIPSRANYIHYLADLLAETDGSGEIPRGKKVSVLDIGVGANCVYPIIGSRAYGWSFVGSDIDPVAVNTANTIADVNPVLKGHIKCRLQKVGKNIFTGVIHDDDWFDLTLCNPPFHGSLAEANAGSQRKVKNLASNVKKKRGRAGFYVKNQADKQKSVLNFGGQGAELWCTGGELEFIKRMISQSEDHSGQCLWFTTLVAQKDHLPAIYKQLKTVAATQVKTIDMQQGQKKVRFVAWTFLSADERAQWSQLRWQ